MQDANYTGGVMAISALIVAGITKIFGTDVGIQNVAQIVFGVIALIGMIKQMIDHKTQSTELASVRAGR